MGNVTKFTLTEICMALGLFWLCVILIFILGFLIEKYDNYERQLRRQRETEEAMLVNIDLNGM